ncbi:hypothetical protein [Variovorax sp. OV329]|uniref:hypothetical protein n=1 Tax=Variovorax sp. OV329 TaxID=1882825 RepID=UPI0008EF7C88|nr:hypothetical protein [Variovorax sp. OV329]SFM42119.1 hypothetical protein SAMN05444747_105140 [Variovorax sp. OV329]
MKLSDLHTGLSLHFDAALAKGSGDVEVGEFSKSSSVSGAIVPTPSDDWGTLKRVLSLPDRANKPLSTPFAVAYVPYREGRIHYHQGNDAVLSGEYSGCLMAVYSGNHHRRVAHVPKASSIDNDCIGEFRDYFQDHSTLTSDLKTKHAKKNHKLDHYFQPFVESRDADIQSALIGKLIGESVIADPYGFTVFGLVTAVDNMCISIWAVKPKKQPSNGEMWHLVLVRARAPVMDFKALVHKKNRACQGDA